MNHAGITGPRLQYSCLDAECDNVVFRNVFADCETFPDFPSAKKIKAEKAEVLGEFTL